ncbi:MAG: phage tail protein [Candidatus Symbiobacter sp.]|nr:phage tail protein [Candidatus Symbiobacter sp.]
MSVSDYLTSPGLNGTISGINIAENCSPAGLNDAIRQLMADIRQYANNVAWFAFGTGSGAGNTIFTRLDATRVQFSGNNMAAYYYPGRRVRANLTTGATITGTITGFSYSGSNNIITVNWDVTDANNNIAFLELGMDSSSLGFAEPTASYQAATKNYVDKMTAMVIPAGSVYYLASTIVPSGFLRADGAYISRSNYARLFAAIGTNFGVGDGYSTFALPDLRGEFIRGHDNGRGVDSGRNLGDWQADMTGPHGHYVTLGVLQGMDAANLGSLGSDNGRGTPHLAGYAANANTRLTGYKHLGFRSSNSADGKGSIWPNDGTESRPRNVALTPIIKF